MGKKDLLSKAEKQKAFELIKTYEGFRAHPYSDDKKEKRTLHSVGYGHGVRRDKAAKAAKIIGVTQEEYLGHKFKVTEAIAKELFYEIDLPIAMRRAERAIPSIRKAPSEARIALVDGSYSSLLQLSPKARGFAADGKGDSAHKEFLNNELWRELSRKKHTVETSTTMLRQARTAEALRWVGQYNYTQKQLQKPKKEGKPKGKFVEGALGAASASLMVVPGARFYHGTPTPRSFLPHQLDISSASHMERGRYFANDPWVAYNMGKRLTKRPNKPDVLEYSLPKEGVYLNIGGRAESTGFKFPGESIGGGINSRTQTSSQVLRKIGFLDALDDIEDRFDLQEGLHLPFLVEDLRAGVRRGQLRDSDIKHLARYIEYNTGIPKLHILEELGFSGLSGGTGFEVIVSRGVEPEPTDVFLSGTKRQRKLIADDPSHILGHWEPRLTKLVKNFRLPDPERALSPAAIRDRDLGLLRKGRKFTRLGGPLAGLAAFVGLGGMAQGKDEPAWYPGKVEDIILRSSLRKAADLANIRVGTDPIEAQKRAHGAAAWSPVGD